MTSTRLKWPSGYDVCCSDDGRLLACLGRNVVVIDLIAKARVSTSHPLSHPSRAAFSPDGTVLAVKATNGMIMIIDPGSGDVLFDHRNKSDGEGSSVLFSEDGANLVDGSWDGVLTVREVRSGAVLKREYYPETMITRLSHDQSRRTWLTQHNPIILPHETRPSPPYLSVRKWPLQPETARKLTFGFYINSATLSPDGLRICFIQKWDDRRVHIARASDGAIICSSQVIEIGGTGDDLKWSIEGRYVCSAQNGGFVIYRASDLAIMARIPTGFPSSSVFLPNGESLALGSWKSSTVMSIADALTGRVTLS